LQNKPQSCGVRSICCGALHKKEQTLNAIYRAHNSSLLVYIHSQLNPLHYTQPYFRSTQKFTLPGFFFCCRSES
jgi:hypothetical protein